MRKRKPDLLKVARHDTSLKGRAVARKKAEAVKAAKKKKIIKSRVEKTRNNKTLTESQFFSKIRSALRHAFRYWNPMQITLKQAARPSQSENKRIKTEYQCASCKEWFPRTGVEIDHIVPCGSLKSMEDIVPFIERLTREEPEAYQVLCKAKCHLEKTKRERKGNECDI